MQTDHHCRLANRLGHCNRELRKQDCVRPLDGLSDQQVTTNQHPMVGGSMQVGDLVMVHGCLGNTGKGLAIIVAKEFMTNIGTPFDWTVFFLASQEVTGADTRDLEALCK